MSASREMPSVVRLKRHGLYPLAARVLVLTLLSWSLPFDTALPPRTSARAEAASLTAQAAVDTLYVNGDAATACGGKSPCFASIQGAIDAVTAGQRIEIQAGTYAERLRVWRKNARAAATEADRIVIEADPAAPAGSVVLRGREARCESGYAIEIGRSKYLTVRGLTVVGAGGRGVGLRGGSLENTGIHLERNRIARGGSRECNGGIDVGRGNPGTVIANNLIHGNGRNGIRFRDGRGGTYHVFGNTIVGNAWSGVQIAHAVALELIDNLIVGNGNAPGPASARAGVRRLRTSPAPASLVRLRGNLVCGNDGGELSGPILDATDAANLTPTGSEGPGVAASAGCGDLAVLFRDVDGADDERDTADDDFRLAAGAPAIDAGVDPRLLGLSVPDDVLESDFDGPERRPRDGDGDDTAAFDAGAHESAGDAQPTPTRTSTPTPSPSPTPGVSASPTPTPVSTATPTPTPTPSPSPSPTPTATASPAPTPSPGPTLSQSPAPTTTPSPAPTPEPSPSPGPTPTIVVATASPAPTPTPTAPPTASPAPTAIPSPTESPRPGNGAPVARGNAYSLRADETLTVAAPGVLGNDTDPDRDPLFGVKLSDPVRGDVAFAADGSFTYTPDPSSLVCPEASAGTGIAFVQSRSTPLSFTNDGSAVNGLAKGDFDHDGNVDLALGGSGNIPGVGNGGFVATMRGNGDGTFAAPVVLLGLGSEAPAGALAKDFDGDGELDLLFAVSSSSRLLLFAGQGNGSFAAPVTITVSHPDGVQAADVNGDEIVDLVTFASADSRVSVLLGNGDGTFGAPTTYPVGSGPQDLAIGDLNGDRAPDLVVGIVNATELDVLLNKNDGTGAFDPARAFNPGMQVRGLYLGDFDDDHDLDVVASGAGCPQGFPPTTLNNGNGCMVFLPGAGDGTFAAPRPQDYVGLEGDFPGRLFSENVTPDLDADGRPDVVFLGGPLGAGNYVFAALGNGQGGFAMTRYVMSRGPAPAPGPQLAGSGVQVDRVHAYAIVVDDFDGDGVADIATGDVGITRPGGVSLLLGTTPGQFAAPRSSSLPEDGLDLNNRFGATGAIALGDFTHGGPLELAVVASGVFTVGELRVVTVQDDGSMTSPTSVVSDGAFSEFHARFARSADFDRDGNLDVVYLGLGGGPAPRVLIRYGDGAGHLTAAATLPYGSSNLWNVVADDFDGDGFPDLAVYNGPFGGVASVDVHRSNGTGRGFTFVGTAGGGNLGPAAFTSLGDLGKAAMVAADFDRDGFVDLAVSRGVDGASGGNPQKSFFLKGHGDGTFSPAVVVGGVTSNGGGISDFAAADLDHDGKLDLIGSSFGFVSVQRGNGDGTFVPLVEYGSSTGGITQMAVADFDRDGHQDVAVVGDNVPYGLSILPGKGDGTLDVAATRKIAVGEIRTVGIAAGDVNGDGKTDLVVEHDGQHINHFTVLLNAAEPSFGCSLTDRFLYRADDGSDASNTTTVELRIAPVDHAPLITSVPVTTALVAQPFTYAVTAFDQDAGDVLAFALVTAPTGMSIDPDGGLVRWVPAASQSGPTSVTVRVYDSAGMFAEQTFPVTVRASVLVPDVVGQTQAAAESALGGAGLTVGTVGTRSSATVPAGSVISQSPLAGSKVVEGTAVSLVVSSGPPAPGEELASIVVRPATDALLIGGTRAFSALAVLGNGSTSDVTNSVAWTSSAPGVATVDASGLASGVGVGSTAIGATLDGVAGSATLEVRAADPGDTSAPLAVITSPTDGGEVTSAVDVVGSATDPSFLRYELASSPAGDDAFTLLATGTSPVVAGVLGRLDPTVLLNGLYELRLRVYDRGGNVAEAIVSVLVTRDQKIGLFSITLQDLNVALSGLPITIERTYDSRDKALGDFGFGWTLQVKTLRLRTNREQGSGWVVSQPTALSYQLAPTVPHYATLTLADGKVETFDLAISPTSSAIVPFTTVTAGYVPRAGTRGSLTVLDNPNLLIVDPQPGEVVLVDDVTLNTFDPKRFRYTSAEGQTFDIDRRKGVERVEDRNGNTLTIGPGGIVHSSGRTVALTRDVQGRITQITDPKGNVRSYAYDARGDLIGATDFVGNVARYAYDGRHGLIDIKDPLGNHVQRNEYDVDGRLIATIDAQGRRTVLTHALGASQEIVRDRLGNETVLEYDAAGNVVAKTDALGGRTESTFDARGNELTERDPLGRVATRTYDAFDNVLSSTDFDGNTTTTTYDLFQQVLTTTDPEGRTTTNGYDARGNLTSVTDPEGGVTQHTYDAAGNRLSTTDPIGRVTTFTYDGFGNLTSTTDPRGVVTADTHDANGRVLTSTKDGLQTRFEWDAAQRVTRTIDPLGHETTRTYSAVGDGTLPATTTDPTGRVTTSTYDERGNLLLRTFPGGTTEIQTYDAENRLASTTDRDGNTTSYAYDALGRQTKVTNPDGTSTATTYDAAGRVLSRTDERGNVTTYVHSANQQTVTDALGHATVNRFDGRGRLIERTDALGRTTEWTFDSRGNVVVTLAADGVASTTTYDLAHQRTAETDRAGRTTQFAYDLGGNLMRVTDAAGQVTEFTYDARGNRLTQTDANGHTTTMTYDGADRLATRTRPLGQQESFTYDAAGREITRTDFNGEATELVYDAAGRLQEKRLSDGSSIPFAFSGAGRRTAAGGDAYVYDVRGRLLEEHKASGDVLAYTYDAAGNKLTSTTSQGTTTDTYDVLNRLASVSDATGATTYGYDAVGNLARTTYPNGNVTTYGYDDLNRLTSLTNAGPGGVLASYTYTLGLAGNRTAVAEAGPATTGRSVGYGYDAVYRLTAETIDAPGTADDLTIAYTYDEVGNRLTMDRGGVVTTSTYDANDRLVTETTGGSTRTSTYDDNGNLIARTQGAVSESYTYDLQGRLAAADGPSGPVSYAYDADGLRIARTAGGATTTYLVDKRLPHGQVVIEKSGATTATYAYGHQRVSQTRGGEGTHFYLYDGQLSTRYLTNTSGAVSDGYTFDAFGVQLGASGGTTNAFRYVGEQLDPNVGFYYLRARYYDQANGRFVATDPLQGNAFEPMSLHRYLYVNADPVQHVDPRGEALLVNLLVFTTIVAILASYWIPALIKARVEALTVLAVGLNSIAQGRNALAEALDEAKGATTVDRVHSALALLTAKTKSYPSLVFKQSVVTPPLGKGAAQYAILAVDQKTSTPLAIMVFDYDGSGGDAVHRYPRWYSEHSDWLVGDNKD